MLIFPIVSSRAQVVCADQRVHADPNVHRSYRIWHGDVSSHFGPSLTQSPHFMRDCFSVDWSLQRYSAEGLSLAEQPSMEVIQCRRLTHSANLNTLTMRREVASGVGDKSESVADSRVLDTSSTDTVPTPHGQDAMGMPTCSIRDVHRLGECHPRGGRRMVDRKI